MRKRYCVIITLIVISIIATTIFIITRKPKQEEVNNENITQSSKSSNYDNTEEIETIKNELNATANTDIYQVEEEPGGRKILQVKPEVQFEVDLAGIIKNAKPEEKELQPFSEKVPKANGVWISNQSRNNFLQLLNKNGIKNFSITEEGYLQSNEADNNVIVRNLQNMINSNKLYIINMTGIAYERDYISGEIVEYPFEDMDPFQIIEPYQKGDKIILEVTSNKKQKLSDKEILETIVQY